MSMFCYFSCVPYVADPENTTLLQTALRLFRKFGQYPQALRLAMQLNDHQLIEEIFTSCNDVYVPNFQFSGPLLFTHFLIFLVLCKNNWPLCLVDNKST